MNSIEFAVRDGVPYAIDFMNPAPDMDINSLTPPYFDWAVKRMADMAIRLAKKPRRQSPAPLEWDAAVHRPALSARGLRAGRDRRTTTTC